MKILINKIKRANRLNITLYFISFLAFLVGYIFLVRSLLHLVGIETLIRIIIIMILSIWLLFYMLFGLSNVITKKYKQFVAMTIINIILVIIMFFVSMVINKIYSNLNMISNQEYTLYTTNLVALKETTLTNSSKLGMINNKEDIEGYVLANTLKEEKKLKQEVVYYDDYYEMLQDLYNHTLDAVFLSSNYVVLFSGEEAYASIYDDTKVLYDYSKKMKTKTNTNTNKKLTEPFTILLMGVDSEIEGLNANAAFNGDTLMLITFNPKNLNATIFSIPRDTYVPIACNNNRYNKINSSAAFGTDCVISTVEQLVDIKIDYYAKINFNGMIDLVNAVDGVDVDVEKPDYSVYIYEYGEGNLCESNSLRSMRDLVCMQTGWQHLNGEQALAYARNRHGFLASDLARNRHQQQIVEALAKKMMKLNSLSGFEKILNSISKNIITNLSTNQILSLYQTLKDMLISGLKGNEFLNIQKTYMEVYNLPVNVGGMTLSALGYYESSLEEIKDALKVNLELKEEKMIKTFSYDYNEEYTSPIIGKGTSDGTKLATVPSFIGQDVRAAEEWGLSNNITINKEFLDCTENTPGLIGDQSVAIGTLVKSITTLTVYINGSCSTDSPSNNDTPNTITPKPKDPTDNKDGNSNGNNTGISDILNGMLGLPNSSGSSSDEPNTPEPDDNTTPSEYENTESNENEKKETE